MKMPLPRVSLLIPCFHAQAYVQEAVTCALRQTYGHVEILLVPDDGDTYLKVRDSIRSPQLRIIPPSSPHPSGAGATRNRALDAADGDFFTMLDADDRIPVDYIETLMAVACDEGAATGNTHYVDESAETVLRIPPIHHRRLSLSGYGQLLASIHPLVHRELEPGYVDGFAEDVVHDGLIYAKQGTVAIVDTSYQARMRQGSACNATDMAEAERTIQAAYQQRIAQITTHPTQVGVHVLSAADRQTFTNLFRFRAFASRIYGELGNGDDYNRFIAGKEALFWDQFRAADGLLGARIPSSMPALASPILSATGSACP